tara:strand:- start:96286 stop:96861 length:576 start_codon:yes stop_codon:yes gene_type:complete
LSIFTKTYDYIISLAGKKYSEYILILLSASESIFFPIPPDSLLIPMSLANQKKAFYYAFLATFSSVAGGMVGYFIGSFAIDLIEPILISRGYINDFNTAKDWFDTWGVLAVFIAGFSPVPYKIFTITAGSLGMFLPGFIFASLIGRGSRFFLVSGLIVWGGEGMNEKIRAQFDKVTIFTAIIIIGIIFYLL